MSIIDGKAISTKLKEELTQEVAKLKEVGIIPGLAVIIVGNDPASKTYVNSKEKNAEKMGLYSAKYQLDEMVTEKELLNLIDDLNNDMKVHGILVQLPLPKHIDSKKVLNSISVEKDVDGFHPENIGKMIIGDKAFLPCTPNGVIKILEYENVEIAGKHAVIIGRSNIVGKPMAALLLERDATVTVCHSKTKNLSEISNTADIIVAAVGRPNFVKADMVKEGAIIIDVGINRVDGKLVGDVDFDSVKEKASLITPVPGGVGPMTIAMLMYNTVESAKRKGGIY
ncbi:MAG: bifunctional methylenetetrahydrofolate dehydrogenase/methenyltetrahydrofolate cyclohydrolase FolD [Clostridiales bacterium]|nr:bifunctional methylenetetrahydrofolate dehydrogenase/methenyltetrahydrofolate cyclohydrolase FolD [Clostridiales bacterium]